MRRPKVLLNLCPSPSQMKMLKDTKSPIPYDLIYVWNVPVELTEAKLKGDHEEQSTVVGGWGNVGKRSKISSLLEELFQEIYSITWRL
jgi:hypothetical protein